MKESILQKKSFDFSVRIVKLYNFFIEKSSNNAILNQIVRSGTSIGANITEAEFAASKKDFIHKLTISLKEANETRYWLRLMSATEIIDQKMFLSLNSDCEELIKLLVSSIKTSKK